MDIYKKYEKFTYAMASIYDKDLDFLMSDPKYLEFLTNIDSIEQSTNSKLFSETFANDPNLMRQYFITGYDYTSIPNMISCEKRRPGIITSADIKKLDDNERSWWDKLRGDYPEAYTYEFELSDKELAIMLTLHGYCTGPGSFPYGCTNEDFAAACSKIDELPPEFLLLIEEHAADSTDDRDPILWAVDQAEKQFGIELSPEQMNFCGKYYSVIHFPGTVWVDSFKEPSSCACYKLVEGGWILDITDPNVVNANQDDPYYDVILNMYENIADYNYYDDGYNVYTLNKNECDKFTGAILDSEYGIHGISVESNLSGVSAIPDYYTNSSDFKISYNGFTLNIDDITGGDLSSKYKEIVTNDLQTYDNFPHSFSVRMWKGELEYDELGIPKYVDSNSSPLYSTLSVPVYDEQGNYIILPVALTEENLTFLDLDSKSVIFQTDDYSREYVEFYGKRYYKYGSSGKFEVLYDDFGMPILSDARGNVSECNSYTLKYYNNPELSGAKDIIQLSDGTYRIYFNNDEYVDYGKEEILYSYFNKLNPGSSVYTRTNPQTNEVEVYVNGELQDISNVDLNTISVSNVIEYCEDSRAYYDNKIYDIFKNKYGVESYVDVRTLVNVDENGNLLNGYKVSVFIGDTEYILSAEDAYALSTGVALTDDRFAKYNFPSDNVSVNNLSVDNEYVSNYFTPCINYSDEMNYKNIAKELTNFLEGSDLRGKNKFENANTIISNKLGSSPEDYCYCIDFFANIGKHCQNLTIQIDKSINMLTAYDDDMKACLDLMIADFFEETSVGYEYSNHKLQFNEGSIDLLNESTLNEQMEEFFNDQVEKMQFRSEYLIGAANGYIMFSCQDLLDLGFTQDEIDDYKAQYAAVKERDKSSKYPNISDSSNVYISYNNLSVLTKLGADSKCLNLYDWAADDKAASTPLKQKIVEQVNDIRYCLTTMPNETIEAVENINKFSLITQKYGKQLFSEDYYKNLVAVRKQADANGNEVVRCDLLSYEEQALIMTIPGTDLNNERIKDINNNLSSRLALTAQWDGMEISDILSDANCKEIMNDFCYSFVDQNKNAESGDVRSRLNERIAYIQAVNYVEDIIADNSVDAGEILRFMGDHAIHGATSVPRGLLHLVSPANTYAEWFATMVMDLLAPKTADDVEKEYLNGEISKKEFMIRNRAVESGLVSDLQTLSAHGEVTEDIFSTAADIAIDAIGIAFPAAAPFISVLKSASAVGKEANKKYEKGYTKYEALGYGLLYGGTSFVVKNWSRLRGDKPWVDRRFGRNILASQAGVQASSSAATRHILGIDFSPIPDEIETKLKEKLFNKDDVLINLFTSIGTFALIDNNYFCGTDIWDIFDSGVLSGISDIKDIYESINNGTVTYDMLTNPGDLWKILKKGIKLGYDIYDEDDGINGVV